jgi:hypothetical protein
MQPVAKGTILESATTMGMFPQADVREQVQMKLDAQDKQDQAELEATKVKKSAKAGGLVPEGLVKVHKDETIQLNDPARVFTAYQTRQREAIKTKLPPSLMGGFTSTGGLAQAPVNKNITFNVSIGFSGDLASKIRNEIKAMAVKELA